MSKGVGLRGLNVHLHDIRGSRLSVAMSEKLRCMDGSYECKFGIVISPARRKPKKHSMKAAHIIKF